VIVAGEFLHLRSVSVRPFFSWQSPAFLLGAVLLLIAAIRHLVRLRRQSA